MKNLFLVCGGLIRPGPPCHSPRCPGGDLPPGDLRFRDLAARQARGDSPYLLINTTLYNDGRRLVLSTLERDALRYDFIHDLQQKPGWEKMTPEAESFCAPDGKTCRAALPRI